MINVHQPYITTCIYSLSFERSTPKQHSSACMCVSIVDTHSIPCSSVKNDTRVSKQRGGKLGDKNNGFYSTLVVVVVAVFVVALNGASRLEVNDALLYICQSACLLLSFEGMLDMKHPTGHGGHGEQMQEAEGNTEPAHLVPCYPQLPASVSQDRRAPVGCDISSSPSNERS